LLEAYSQWQQYTLLELLFHIFYSWQGTTFKEKLIVFITKERVILGDNETIERMKYSSMLYVVMGSRRGTTF
jgi:hypothetical protein